MQVGSYTFSWIIWASHVEPNTRIPAVTCALYGLKNLKIECLFTDLCIFIKDVFMPLTWLQPWPQ